MRTETLADEGDRKLRSGKVFSPSKSAEKSPKSPKNKRNRKSDEFSTGRQSLKSTFELKNSNNFIDKMVEIEKTEIENEGRTRSGRLYSPVKTSRGQPQLKSPQNQIQQEGKFSCLVLSFKRTRIS